MELENNDKCSGKKCSVPCCKFLVAATISFVTTGTGICMLFTGDSTLITIGSSLLSTNLTYWLRPPKVWNKES